MHDDTTGDEVIAALAPLRPVPPDPGALAAIAFEAGRRAGRRSARRWKTTSAAMAIAITAVVMWPRLGAKADPHLRSGAAIATTAVERVPPSREVPRQDEPSSALLLTQQVMQHGLDGLPPLRARPSRAEPVRPESIRPEFFERGEW